MRLRACASVKLLAPATGAAAVFESGLVAETTGGFTGGIVLVPVWANAPPAPIMANTTATPKAVFMKHLLGETQRIYVLL
jgi:hypothetical protein